LFVPTSEAKLKPAVAEPSTCSSTRIVPVATSAALVPLEVLNTNRANATGASTPPRQIRRRHQRLPIIGLARRVSSNGRNPKCTPLPQ